MIRCSLGMISFLVVGLLALAPGVATASDIAEADLAVTKTDDMDPVLVGAPVTYTLTIRNLGPDTSGQITVNERVPFAFDCSDEEVDPSDDCFFCEGCGVNFVLCSLDPLAAEESTTVETTCNAPGFPGEFTRSGDAFSNVHDPDLDNNRDDETTTVIDPCTSDADCDDGMFCNGTETCDVETGFCGVVTACPPSTVGCLVSAGCDEENHECIFIPEDGLCPPGRFCAESGECTLPVAVDIKPGACPNPWNRNGRGVLTVALVGSEEFDVSDVDVTTLAFGRADGEGGSAVPNEGPPGPHSMIKDIATAFAPEETCDCDHLGADGTPDLSLKFRTDLLVEEFEIDELLNGEMVPLVVTGKLLDGSAFEGSDCVRLVPPGTPPDLLAVQSNAADAWIDVAPLDDQIDGGGFAGFERTYPSSTEATLTASSTHQGRAFRGWKADGGRLVPGETFQIVVDGHIQNLEAVYAEPSPRCGIGFELVLLLSPVLWLQRRLRRRKA